MTTEQDTTTDNKGITIDLSADDNFMELWRAKNTLKEVATSNPNYRLSQGYKEAVRQTMTLEAMIRTEPRRYQHNTPIQDEQGNIRT